MQNLSKEKAVKLLQEWQKNPEAFIRFCWPKAYLTPDQLKVLRAITAGHRKIAVRAGHGVGKTWLEARLAVWFVTVFKPSVVPTTAPTFHQVKNLLWREIASAHASSRVPLGNPPLQTEWTIRPDNYAFGISTRETGENKEFGATRMQGIHSKHMLVILDEAAGVLPEIWKAVDSIATGLHNIIIAFGNPASPSGAFFECFKSPSWHKIGMSSLNHPNVLEDREVIAGAVTKAWCDEKRIEWGENSPLYTAKVKGEFPDEGDDTLIPLSWVERAVNRKLEKGGVRTLGGDIARYGEDESVLFSRNGLSFSLHWATNKKSLTETVGKIIATKEEIELDIKQENEKRLKELEAKGERIPEELQDESISWIGIDDGGVGGGATDMLEEQGYNVDAINFGSSAIDSEHFTNLKAEAYWMLRKEFEHDVISIPDDPLLINQLASIKFTYDSKGRIKIESKDDMKRRGLKSPDRADALVICYYAGRRQKMPELFFV